MSNGVGEGSIKISDLFYSWFGCYDVLKIRRNRMSQSVIFQKKSVLVWNSSKKGLNTPPPQTKNKLTIWIIFFNLNFIFFTFLAVLCVLIHPIICHKCPKAFGFSQTPPCLAKIQKEMMRKSV